MGLLMDYEFIVKNSKGEIYNIYLNENKQIEYIVANTMNQWEKKHTIFHEAIYSFSVDIDKFNQIHIISLSTKGVLRYHSFKSNQWIHQELADCSKYSSEIYYPSIKILHNKVHIFYYFHYKKHANICSLIHLVKTEEGWSKKSLIDITFREIINPFHLMLHDKKMHILFGSLDGKCTQIYLTSYDTSLGQWNHPLKITESTIDKVYLSGIIDERNTLHIAWSDYDEKGLAVQYTSYNFNRNKEDTLILSLSEKSNASFPLLLFYKNILWCTWTQMNKLYSCYSKDRGKSWSLPLLSKESQGIHYKRYRYISSGQDEQQGILCDFLYGTLYPKIQFIGFGGEII
ncbi:hypothetical protein [Clostridium formicaceticum]|uniref:Sialidase domain-containing protein n=1 Tax=Clostridium formicaceticum TaxID=1497 RepID=A0AAC9RI42_9CLOT|nr:hypothetical protein [Clostridium formicaceticum]AOY76970.1 hypothetical protein BJL90_14560 [Clostridium formicaceticum]ARE87454.1 hypothetical protein CLFO_18540 [Clostridium formicaceticum]